MFFDSARKSTSADEGYYVRDKIDAAIAKHRAPTKVHTETGPMAPPTIRGSLHLRLHSLTAIVDVVVSISMTNKQSLQQVPTVPNLVDPTRHEQKRHHSARDLRLPQRWQTQSKGHRNSLLGRDRQSFHAPSAGTVLVGIVRRIRQKLSKLRLEQQKFSTLGLPQPRHRTHSQTPHKSAPRAV